MNRVLTRLVAVAALALLPAAVPAPASAAGTAGYCKDDTGTTVVVDFTELGGNVVVRCSAKAGSGVTGLAALQAAGFTVEGTQREGMAFVCRISGRPGPDEELAIEGDEDYTESCEQTPPRAAYWTYWQAKNGGPWAYGDAGATSSTTVAGGFEGWSFSLNGSKDAPGATPKRPASTTTPSPTPKPSHAPQGDNGSPSSTPSAGSPSADPTDEETDREKKQREAEREKDKKQKQSDRKARREKDDAEDDASAAPSAASNVTGDLPESNDAAADTGTPMATVLGAGALGVLGLGAAFVAWRRSRTG